MIDALYSESVKRLGIMAEHGKDEEAEGLLQKLFISLLLLTTKDFWIFLYDWLEEVTRFFNKRKIKLEGVLYG